jgi:hypothetical protein
LIQLQLISQGVLATNLDDPAFNVPCNQLNIAHKACRHEWTAAMKLRGACSLCYGVLKTDLANNMMLGQDKYLKDEVEVMRLLHDYKLPVRTSCIRKSKSKGVAFMQDGVKKPPGRE